MSRLVDAVGKFLRETIWLETRGARRLVRLFTRLLRVCVLVGKGFYDNNCFLRASALSFTTILSLVPILAFAFLVLRGLPYENVVQDWIVGQIAAGRPEVAEAVKGFIDSAVSAIKGASAKALGLSGLALLLWTTVKVLSTVEATFNSIWGVARGRTWLRKVADYISIVVVTPVLLAAAVGVSTYLNIDPPAFLGESGRHLASAAVAVGLFVPVWVAFGALYAFMPNTRVKFSAAVVGGLMAALLWRLAFWGYAAFEVGVAKNNAIYGGFAALPIFMFWLYISWVVTLFGAEVTFAFEHVETYRRHLEHFKPSIRACEEIALRVFLEIAKAFRAGAAAPGVEALSRRTGLPPKAVQETVDSLSAAALVSIVGDQKPDACQPAKDISMVTPGSVIAALRAKGDTFESEDDDALWRRTRSLSQEFERQLGRDDLSTPISQLLDQSP
ncbi:MAG: YihY/virulence factor BrkB family protein [Planctomycetes bacterium]|nr:YihY/virulence factor BrkB family protein [Planctomycetota bacterium]